MKDIGIDLGTANILVYVKGQGVVLNEPSVLAIDAETKNVLAVGKAANDMLGRTPGKVKAIKPLKEGVIADFEYTEAMLVNMIKKIKGLKFWVKPRILICCPSNVTAVEKNAIRDVAEKLGAKKVFVEEEPKVAALGSGLDISKPGANMVIDIGGGTTDIAILSLGGIVNGSSIKVAGNTFDNAISEYIREKYKLLIGERTAENIKFNLGSVFRGDKSNKKQIKGRNLETGLPDVLEISEKEIEEALYPYAMQIIKETKKVLEATSPELSADIVDKGIVLTGGGAMVKGLSELFEQELKVPIYIAESPLTCVVEGCGIMLSNLNLLDN